MRIFITGGAGFIGKPLVLKLENEGHSLLLLIRKKKEKPPVFKGRLNKKTRFLSGDLESVPELLSEIKSFKPEAGIHLAWEGIPSAGTEINLKNLKDGLACVETLAKAGAKRIFVSGSCHEYGEPGKKVDEMFLPNPLNTLYAAKTALYFLGSKIAESYGVKFIWGRIGFVYGPGQRQASLIPYLLNSIQKNEEPVFRNPRGGNDFIYVDDVASAISMLIKKENLAANEIFNIGSGRLTSVAYVANLVVQNSSQPRLLKEPKKPVGFCVDISKIRRKVGWEPKIGIEEGIKKTMEYYNLKIKSQM